MSTWTIEHAARTDEDTNMLKKLKRLKRLVEQDDVVAQTSIMIELHFQTAAHRKASNEVCHRE